MINPVGHLKANELGICDMNGNVWEWCADWYGHYEEDDAMNPQGLQNGNGACFAAAAGTLAWNNAVTPTKTAAT